MFPDEPNLRIYERAFSGHPGGKGSMVPGPSPIRLTDRDFAPGRQPWPEGTRPILRRQSFNLDRLPGFWLSLAGLFVATLRPLGCCLRRWPATTIATSLLMAGTLLKLG